MRLRRDTQPSLSSGPAGRRGYVLMAALAAAALTSVVISLHQTGRLQAAHQAFLERRWWPLFNELSGGRLGDAVAALEETEVDKLTPSSLRARTSAAEREPPEDPCLVDDERHLDNFHEAMLKLGEGERNKARILFFGTSEIGYDVVTSQLRRNLQERFGDGGKGWVLIDRTWNILDHRDVVWKYDDEAWTGFSIRTGGREDGRYGLGGVLHVSREPTVVEFSTVDDSYGVEEGFNSFPSGTAWSQIELHYRKCPACGPITLVLDDKPLDTITTQHSSVEDGVYSVQMPTGPHTLRIEVGKQEVHAYGAVLEQHTGVVVDALMVIGAWGRSLDNHDEKHLAASVNRREPALLIFQYGAKEVLESPDLSPEQLNTFGEEYLQSIRKVRTAAPEASCLVVSPKDQGIMVAGRIETAAGLPKIVDACREVAARAGCAFYDLYSAMGGEGTIRRWYHQSPRLAGADYKHLSMEGSIRIGDILSNVLLEEIDAYGAWRRAQSGELLLAKAPAVAEPAIDPPTLDEIAAFSAPLAEDPLKPIEPCQSGNLKAIDCRDPSRYITTNERGQPLWKERIAGLGEGYVGVGADDNYSLIAATGSRWAWLFSSDATVIRLHRIIRALVLMNKSPVRFVGAFRTENRALTRKRLATHLDATTLTATERTATLHTFDDLQPELYQHFRRSRRGRPRFAGWGWLHNRQHYGTIATLFNQGRIRFVAAALEGRRGLRAIAHSARSMGVPIRVAYLSNEESRWRKPPLSVRENVRALPFDARSVVLRTISGRRWNRKRGFSRWHYNIHAGLHLQQLLKKGAGRSPSHMLRHRRVVSDYLSWLGPSLASPSAHSRFGKTEARGGR